MVKPKPSLRQRLANRFSRWREKRAVGVLAKYSAHGIAGRNRFVQWRVKQAMGVLRRTGRGWHQVRNWYEGGFPFLTGDQSWLNQVVQDARFDQNFVTRREMMRRMRNHAQDVPIHKAGLSIRRQYVIGRNMPTVTSMAQSNDPDEAGNTWGRRAEQVFHEMCQNLGFNGESFYQLLCTAIDCKGNDGDITVVKTSRKGPMPTASGQTVLLNKPALQLVEAHRVETPFNRWDREGHDIIDGVQFDEVKTADGRTVMQKKGYWVKDTVDPLSFKENYTMVDVDQAMMLFRSTRVNQVRGLSDYYAVETTVHLLRDLLKLEMRAQERQSNFAVFISNATGQAFDPEVLRKVGFGDDEIKVNADGQVYLDRKQAADLYQKMYGGEVYAGFNGDDFKLIAPNRPSEATLALWEFLIDSYCAGSPERLPRVLVFGKNMGGGVKGQGTEVRAELDAANSGFVSEFNLSWKPLIHWVWDFCIGWGIKNDYRLADPPEDWRNIEVSPPRSVLVDVGYDSQATIAELAAGITNFHTIAQQLGTTRDKLIEHSVNDVLLLKVACAKATESALAKKFGITIDAAEVRQSLGDVMKNLSAAKSNTALTQLASAT